MVQRKLVIYEPRVIIMNSLKSMSIRLNEQFFVFCFMDFMFNFMLLSCKASSMVVSFIFFLVFFFCSNATMKDTIKIYYCFILRRGSFLLHFNYELRYICKLIWNVQQPSNLTSWMNFYRIQYRFILDTSNFSFHSYFQHYRNQ